MSQCPRCGKRVFFAERKSSLGKDWHWQCLKCEACSKVLNPGQHAERKGIPYCEVPCYKSLFGPKLYGFGSQVESHDYSPKTGRRLTESQSSSESANELVSPPVSDRNKINASMSSPRIDGRALKVTPEQLMDLEDKLKIHNDVHKSNFINLIEKDGHVTLEGSLRVHWGVQSNIKFKKDDSHEATFTNRVRARRINKTRSFHSDLYADVPEVQVTPPTKDPFGTLKSSGIPPEISSQQLLAVKMKRGQFHTIREQKIKRRFSINGHYYRNETSEAFTPAFGSVTQVYIGSHLRTVEVIKRLLDKFKIVNDPASFALYMVKVNGEMWPLADTGCPLMERVELQDPSARMFLMDKPYHQQTTTDTMEESGREEMTLVSATISDVWKPVEESSAAPPADKISHELAGYIGLPDAMLAGFITMFNNEQQIALEKTKESYERVRSHIKKLMSDRQLTQETYL